MGILLAIAAALVYGAADFAGGLASRRSSTWTVVVISQTVGFALLLAIVALGSPAAPHPADLWWGAVAGIAGCAAIALLYRALAVGRMSIVSPITAALAAVLPVLFGVVRGERPSLPAIAGIALAFIAVVLVSAVAGDPPADNARAGRLPPGIAPALLAGAGFGLFFILLAQTSPHAGMWPLVGARAGSIPLLFAVAIAARQTLRPAPGGWPAIALAGLLDMGANVLYLAATKFALLAIVAVLTSLYPAATVLLAWIVLRERLSAVQWSGVACAGAGIVLIALR